MTDQGTDRVFEYRSAMPHEGRLVERPVYTLRGLIGGLGLLVCMAGVLMGLALVMP